MKPLTFLLALATLMSCNQTSDKNTSITPVNVDSLTATFLAGWNNKDSAAIMNTIAENAIVMNDSLIHNGHLAIANNWINNFLYSFNHTTSILFSIFNRPLSHYLANIK